MKKLKKLVPLLWFKVCFVFRAVSATSPVFPRIGIWVSRAQLYTGEEGKKKDQWMSLNRDTSVKYRGRLCVSKRRCVKVTIQPRRSSKHAVITPLSQKFSLFIHVRRSEKQIAECSCHMSKLPLVLLSDLMWSVEGS